MKEGESFGALCGNALCIGWRRIAIQPGDDSLGEHDYRSDAQHRGSAGAPAPNCRKALLDGARPLSGRAHPAAERTHGGALGWNRWLGAEPRLLKQEFIAAQ